MTEKEKFKKRLQENMNNFNSGIRMMFDFGDKK